MMCLPILEVDMPNTFPHSSQRDNRDATCGSFSVSTGENYFRKLSLMVNTFLTFPLPFHCECEDCMSSLKISEGTMNTAVQIS